MRLIDADAMKESLEIQGESEIGEMMLAWIDMQPTVETPQSPAATAPLSGEPVGEAVEPIIQEARDAFDMTSRWYMCGECQTPIDPGDRYCRHCGRMVKWE